MSVSHHYPTITVGDLENTLPSTLITSKSIFVGWSSFA